MYNVIIYRNALVIEIGRYNEYNRVSYEPLEVHEIKEIDNNSYISLEAIKRLVKQQNNNRSKEIKVTFYDFDDSYFNIEEFKAKQEERKRFISEKLGGI